MLDLLVREGWVIDGTGNPAFPADVGIERDTIVAVGRMEGAQAARVIDARGRIVCPGFVDAHSHTDWSIHANPTAESTIRQGITTEIVGNCGNGNAPVSSLSREWVAGRLKLYGYTEPVAWSSFGSYLEQITGEGISCNLGWFVGHNTLRAAAGVSEPIATDDQLRAMELMMAEAMEAGALGLSTGLEFEPGRLAPTGEIVRLASVAGARGGYYTSHIRNRDSALQEAVDEFLEVARRSGCRAELSHLNVRYNSGAAPGAWHRAVETMAQARRDGVDVLADTTPFPDGLGLMAGILPPWVLAGGPASAAGRLKNAAVRTRLRDECDRYWRFIHKGEWHRVRLLQSEQYPELSGKSFPEIAELWRKDVWDCYFDVLAAAGEKMYSLNVIGLLFTDEHMAEMISHPLFNLAVDGFSSRLDGTLAQQMRHPLGYAGMVHYLTHHVRTKKTLRLEEAIRKMTSMPARHFGFDDRGRIQSGAKADLVVLDFESLDDVSTLDQPLAYVSGIEYVTVNGVVVVDGGKHTGARPGRHLPRR